MEDHRISKSCIRGLGNVSLIQGGVRRKKRTKKSISLGEAASVVGTEKRMKRSATEVFLTNDQNDVSAEGVRLSGFLWIILAFT